MIRLTLPYPMAVPGVYRITDAHTGRFYIGSSVNIAKRWAQHRGRLCDGSHPNPMLQAIWNVDPVRLSVTVVVETERTREALLRAEQDALDAAGVGSNRSCMNVLRVAGSHLGAKRSDATRAAMAAAQLGKKHSESAKAKQRAAKLGRPQSAEHRRKCGEARRGKPGTPRAGIPKPSLRRLSDAQVLELRASRDCGTSWRLLGLAFGISAGAAKRAALGISYARLCGK